MIEYSTELSKAVKVFWQGRRKQAAKQGSRSGKKDAGARGAVTGGKQLDGFITLIQRILKSAGITNPSIHMKSTTLPGYFRPTKNWDVVVVDKGNLLASIEFKSHVGPSFGNNYNNRVEEAIGSAHDLLTAYREGAFKPSQKPWLGWLMLLEEAPRSTSPVSTAQPHFEVFKEFEGASYAKRYEIFCERLVRERLYDATCLMLSNAGQGKKGGYSEPNIELSFSRFASSLTAHALAWSQHNG